MRHSCFSFGAVLCLASCAAVSQAAFPTVQTLAKSSWNSAYTTPDGNQVPALIKFRGNAGTYDTPFGQGRLAQIRYGVDATSMPGRPFFQISGQWSFQGQSGQFIFTSDGPERFKGSWQGQAGRRPWNGSSMFGMWRRDPNSERFYCEYRYPDRGEPGRINVQLCIWYPNDPDRSNYYYFANRENKVWGRCVCPASSQYDPNVMQWGKLNGDQWNDLPPGACPPPADGDPGLSAIDRIPDPPV
jgi:hypothetical protein